MLNLNVFAVVVMYVLGVQLAGNIITMVGFVFAIAVRLNMMGMTMW